MSDNDAMIEAAQEQLMRMRLKEDRRVSERAIMICTTEELKLGFTDKDVDAAYQWGDPRRYAPVATRLRSINKAAYNLMSMLNPPPHGLYPAQLEAIEELRKALGTTPAE